MQSPDLLVTHGPIQHTQGIISFQDCITLVCKDTVTTCSNGSLIPRPSYVFSDILCETSKNMDMGMRLFKCTKVTVCILATAINKELHSKSVSTYYLSHELIDKGIHKVWLSLLSVNDGHGVKGHCVVVLKRQQLCYLPQMSSRLLGQRFVGLEELRYGIRVLLLRDTAGRIMMSWLHHQIRFLATILTQYEVNLY